MRAMPNSLAALGVLALFILNVSADAPATNALPAPAVTNAMAAPATNTLAAPAIPPGPSLYNFTVNSLDGKPVDLGQFRGRVALVVNTASNCGFVSQYAGLEKLYEDYKDKGFVVLAFPCNDFGGQEPGSTKDIATLCSTKFDVTFPLFEKTKTRGDGQSPVYQFLATGHGTPNWNFHKYLVDKNGRVIQEFQSQTNPQSKDVKDAVEAALKT
jgi:glutathione peroxidase